MNQCFIWWKVYLWRIKFFDFEHSIHKIPISISTVENDEISRETLFLSNSLATREKKTDFFHIENKLIKE